MKIVCSKQFHLVFWRLFLAWNLEIGFRSQSTPFFYLLVQLHHVHHFHEGLLVRRNWAHWGQWISSVSSAWNSCKHLPIYGCYQDSPNRLRFWGGFQALLPISQPINIYGNGSGPEYHSSGVNQDWSDECWNMFRGQGKIWGLGKLSGRGAGLMVRKVSGVRNAFSGLNKMT